MPSYLVTGASRGLGLGFVTELLKDPNNVVIATARNTTFRANGLQELKARQTDDRLHLVDLDVSSSYGVLVAAEEVSKLLPDGLDCLISNAGVAYTGQESFENVDIDALKAEVDFTVTSPILLIRAFLPLIRKAPTKKILIITSILASIESAANMPGLANGYSVSRAALNMVVRKWSTTLRLEGIIAAMIHPGWVLTEIGDMISGWMATYAPDHAPISMEESAEGVVKVLQGLSVVDAGAFLDYKGNSIPF